MKSTICPPSAPVVLAVAAHPDDIEFVIAGTLALLKGVGCETHYLTVANGGCGSVQYDAKTLIRMRADEARRAAQILDATFHPSLTNDLEIFYDLKTLRRVAAVIREIKPAIVLTHSPHDYMEDHTNTCRLAVTAAFTHGMPNFKTIPAKSVFQNDVTVYHCMPFGLCDGLRREIIPGAYVNTTSVHKTKLAALAEHRSQQDWLDASQGMNSYLAAMEKMSREMGRRSRRFQHAEGWRRHLHCGFSAQPIDPLAELLGKNYLINRKYETELGKQLYAS
jgi:LmbE family N-acetylglucosaminyl deacetylase